MKSLPKFLSDGLFAIAIILLSLTTANAAQWISINPAVKYQPPYTEVLEQGAGHLLVKFTFSGIMNTEIPTDQGIFHRIQLDDYPPASKAELGHPMLPYHNVMIHIPDGSIGEAHIIEAKYEKLGNFRPYPLQLPKRDDAYNNNDFAYDADAYLSPLPIPQTSVSVNTPQGWGGIYVSGLYVSPFRYLPATQSLEIASSIVVRVDFIPTALPEIVKPNHPSARLAKMHQNALLNPPISDIQPFDLDDNEPVRLLVVLREEVLDIVAPLIDFHHATGLRAETWFINDIENLTPRIVQDRIREMYVDGLEYVLLIGDGHQNQQAQHIPMFFWDPIDPPIRLPDTGTHSDYWLVTLDPPDRDGFDDHLAELSVGRIVYDRINQNNGFQELQRQIDKLMDYLTWNLNNDGEYLNNCILVADNSLVEGVPEYLNAKQSVERFNYSLPAPNFITAYGNVQGMNNRFVVDRINEGVGIMNYRGHGDETRMASWNRAGESITSGTLQLIQNRDRPFVLISSACLNANIADYNPINNLNSVLESFQKYNGASVSAHGSVISSWTDGNSFFDINIFRQWFDNGIHDLGFSANIACAEMVARFDLTRWPTVGRMNARTYIWLGDPMLEVRISAPQELGVDLPVFIPLNAQGVTADISINDQPQPNIRFTIYNEDNSIYLTGLTDNNGEITVQFDRHLEANELFFWSAYERNAIPVFGELSVIDGAGSISGRVTQFGNNAPLPGAVIEMDRFNLSAVADANGNYQIEGAPDGMQTLICSYDGYLSQSVEANILRDEVTNIDFSLRYSQAEVSADNINITLKLDERVTRTIELRNEGNGDLEYSASIEFIDDLQPYEMIFSHDIVPVILDNRVNGVVQVEDGRTFIAGGNNNADPNYIYVLNTNGALVSRIEQPEGSSGVGMRDLAYDGEFIYGSFDQNIIQMNLQGEPVASYYGIYNPNIALTVDDDGNFWVGSDRDNIICLDRNGHILQEINNGAVSVRGLTWRSNAPDNFNLLMMVRGDENDGIQFYGCNPETEEIRFLSVLSFLNGEYPGDALCITNQILDGTHSLLGISYLPSGERHLRVWHLDYRRDWIEFENHQGTISPEESVNLDLTFSSFDYPDFSSMSAMLQIVNNGRQPLIQIPILLSVDYTNIPESDKPTIPSDFSVGPAYPNPFNAITRIPFALPNSAKISLSIFDIHGREIMHLFEGTLPSGYHSKTFDASSLPGGIYFASLKTPTQRTVTKILLIK